VTTNNFVELIANPDAGVSYMQPRVGPYVVMSTISAPISRAKRTDWIAGSTGVRAIGMSVKVEMAVLEPIFEEHLLPAQCALNLGRAAQRASIKVEERLYGGKTGRC
jgi:hypothetical protein